MRIGAAFFYVTTGLILAYMASLLEEIHTLSVLGIEETKQRTI
jgi:hypothetical protein